MYYADVESEAGGITISRAFFELPSGTENRPFDPTRDW